MFKKVTREMSCRLCLEQNRRYVHDFNDKNCPKAVSLEEKMQQVLQLKLKADPNLPSAICLRCRNRIEEWYEYKNLVLQNQEHIAKSAYFKEDLPDAPTGLVTELEPQEIAESDESVDQTPERACETSADSTIESYLLETERIDDQETYEPYTPKVETDSAEDRRIEILTAMNDHSYSCMDQSDDESLTDFYMGTWNQNQDKSSSIIDKNRKYLSNPEEVGLSIKKPQQQLMLERYAYKRRRTDLSEGAVLREIDNSERDNDESADQKVTNGDYTEDAEAYFGRNPEIRPYITAKTERKLKREFMLKAKREKLNSFKFEYDKWSKKVDLAIRKFFPYLNCQICSLPMDTFNSLRIHMIKRHGNMAFECCDRSFATRAEVYNHILYHQDPRTFKSCDDCCLAFESHARLLHHNQERHSKPTFKCEGCSMAFRSKFEKIKHYSEVHLPSKWTTCEFCPEIRLLSSKLSQHYALIHKSVPTFKCKVCPFVHKSHYKLVDHEEDVHRLHVQNYICLHCGNLYHNIRGYKTHFATHIWHPKCYKFIDCPKCDLIFSKDKELDLHDKNIHKKKW